MSFMTSALLILLDGSMIQNKHYPSAFSMARTDATQPPANKEKSQSHSGVYK